MSQLIVRFSSGLNNIEWYAIDANSQLLDSQKDCSLSDIPLEYKNHNIRCYLLVEPPFIQIHQVKFPKKLSYTQLKLAIPNYLEDQLLENIDDLHFAISPQDNKFSVTVAVVKKSLMTLWIEKFEEEDLNLQNILPLFLTIPDSSDTWQLIYSNGYCHVKTEPLSGFTIKLEHINQFATLFLQKNTNIESLNVYCEDKDLEYFSKNADLGIIGTHITMLSLPSLPEVLDTQKFNVLNLRQGEFEATRHFYSTALSFKKATVATLSICMAIFICTQLGKYWILSNENANQLDEINQIYYALYPKASAVISPKLRITKELDTLKQENTQNHFLLLLGMLSKTLNHDPAIKVQSLNYRDGAFRLDLTAKRATEVEQVVRNIQKVNIQVKQQKILKKGNTVHATLLVTK